MAKENPDTKPKKETPFQRFERLARRIARVPKDKLQDSKNSKRVSV